MEVLSQRISHCKAENGVAKVQRKAIRIRFTNVNEENGNEKYISIKNGGKVIKSTRNCNLALATCKNPFRKGSISYVYIKMRQEFTCLGIVESYNTDAFSFSNNSKCVFSYFYYGRWGTINWCKGGEHLETLQQMRVINKWEVGETVKMKVDLVKFEITFYNERQMLGKPVRIEERDAYFPAVQIWGKNILEIVD